MSNHNEEHQDWHFIELNKRVKALNQFERKRTQVNMNKILINV